MNLKCNNCGNENCAWWGKTYPLKGTPYETCDRCGAKPPKTYDVYLDKEGYNPNICDKKTGQPIPFSSKSEKAKIMQNLGISEAGDRVHGGW